MIKDTLQKQKAIRYCVAAGLVPYPEVVVRYSVDVTDVVSDISDIDVLGIKPAGEHPLRLVLFDCKTQAKISAVSRALWSAGLKQLVGADEGFVILNKAAPEAHRLAANSLRVRLFSEKLFDNFGTSTSINYVPGQSYLEEIAAWEELLTLRDRYKQMNPLLSYLLNDAPLEKSATQGFRMLLARLKQVAGELDATKQTHCALYGMAVSQALVFLSAIARDFQNVFDPEMQREHFAATLRYFVWGGKDDYELRERLNRALKENRGDDTPAFDLPSWPKFVELMRGLMDAPSFVGASALPVKDLAFRELCAPREIADRRIWSEMQANNRNRQFALSTSRYISSLSRFLQDSGSHFASTLVSPPPLHPPAVPAANTLV